MSDNVEMKKENDSFKKSMLDEVISILDLCCPTISMAARGILLVKKGMDYFEQRNVHIEVPNYMGSVLYKCKEGYYLTEADQCKLKQIILGEFESTDTERINIIADFISNYLGEATENANENEYLIGDSYVVFNFDFRCGDEYPCDEEEIAHIMEVINALLGKKLFDCYAINGYMESYMEE